VSLVVFLAFLLLQCFFNSSFDSTPSPFASAVEKSLFKRFACPACISERLSIPSLLVSSRSNLFPFTFSAIADVAMLDVMSIPATSNDFFDLIVIALCGLKSIYLTLFFAAVLRRCSCFHTP
jgi:hypothetical protein